MTNKIGSQNYSAILINVLKRSGCVNFWRATYLLIDVRRLAKFVGLLPRAFQMISNAAELGATVFFLLRMVNMET